MAPGTTQPPAASQPPDEAGNGGPGTGGPGVGDTAAYGRDLADVPAVEVVSTAALHLMSAAAVHLGLAEDLPEHRDLDEARTLIDALAGLVVVGAPRLGHHHAAPLRDGLRSLQLAFREASRIADPPGEAPGERYTGPVLP
jgi:hypothetical protein